ncbi:MAG: universal stress protein [Muribaculum sp.]|nr:universal stress protein [Muribaculum sp.]
MITLCIHTYEYALGVKKLLEAHGISVSFEKYFENKSDIATAVKINIDEANLSPALRIIESGKFSPLAEIKKLTGVSNIVLIPVDFSNMCMLAVRAGFELAERLSLKVVILHAVVTPYFAGAVYGQENPDFPYMDTQAEFNEVVASSEIDKDADKLMTKLSDKIKHLQEIGQLPQVEFSTEVDEGVAEEVILEYTRTRSPALVVMANRGRHKREKEMVGSVTAEVIDSCRVPLFTVPENYSFCGIRNITRLAFFCNLDQQDILSLDNLMRLFGYPNVDVWLIPVNDRAGSSLKTKLDSLCKYFSSNYPSAIFHSAPLDPKTFRSEFENLVQKENLQLIIVPNKKKNILSRLFNPGIAHKILFERDMPLLALPV